MDESGQDKTRREVVSPPHHLGLLFATFVIASAAMLGTVVILDFPATTRWVAASWHGSGTRTLPGDDGDANTRIAALSAERDDLLRRLATANRADSSVTGSVRTSGQASAPEPVGADLGPMPTVAALRQAWGDLSGRLGDDPALRPLLAVRESGDSFRLHLVIGPFASTAGAQSACARLSADAGACSVVPYDGQRLDLAQGQSTPD